MEYTSFDYNGQQYSFFYFPGDPSGLACIAEIVTNNEYVLDLFADFKNEVFIDIGANCGVATIIMAKQNPESIVIAFEPDPKVFTLLEKNVNENNLKNCKLYNMAVAKKGIDEIFLTIKAEWSGASTIVCKKDIAENKINVAVQCKNFDDIITDIPLIRLLKIDCEGSEYEILYNSMKFKNKVVQNIVGEFHSLYYNECDNNIEDLMNYCKLYTDGIIRVTCLTIDSPEHKNGYGEQEIIHIPPRVLRNTV
jgi:FkbM family methyltransferase